MKSLVVYFSATGVTKKLALHLANVIDCDVVEISPKYPYSEQDLDWRNPKSRTSIEMQNLSSRPEVIKKDIDMSKYDKIFIGFPIWWYIAPTIINSFLESYDFTNKLIIPFATSGGSNMGETNKFLFPSCKGAKLVEGKRLSNNISDQALKDWALSFLY